ncbi:hypothetical protein DOTSEDRAFT_73936 [Dothistroma septosporum NZE10]|uniref:Uncharacterized protein n=1 Tax=Dothistroma septosporum (strain NZE10 / CBS 128990) TaxID=675120 RepID=N1PGI5_DOTSN|nr:hypothetical protein DOTSEDRAFT_73936 [Dothistroma septosporum NZE10]
MWHPTTQWTTPSSIAECVTHNTRPYVLRPAPHASLKPLRTRQHYGKHNTSRRRCPTYSRTTRAHPHQRRHANPSPSAARGSILIRVDSKLHQPPQEALLRTGHNCGHLSAQDRSACVAKLHEHIQPIREGHK